METTGSQLAKSMPQGMESFYKKSGSSAGGPEYFPYIKIIFNEGKNDEDKVIGYEWVMKMPGQKDYYHLGDTIQGKILATYICYNYYDVEAKKATVETNKYNYGDTVVIYDYAEDKVIDCGKDKERFKTMQQAYKDKGMKLKYNKVLYVQLESGTIVEMYVKLSQTHKVRKVDGKFGYDLENPLVDGLDPIMKGLGARYPYADMEIGVGMYQINPVTYTYPTFKQVGETDPDYDVVQDVFKRINEVSMGKLINVTADKVPDTIDEDQEVVQEATVVESEVINVEQTLRDKANVGFNPTDDLPF